MVRLLVELKLRLLAGGIRAGGVRSRIGFAIAWVFAVGMGVVGALLLVALRRVESDALAGDLLALGFAFLFLIWTLGPLTVGAEGTLEADRLAMLPIPAQQLMPGLLAAGAVGFGGLATVLYLAGAAIGMAPASPMAAFTVVGVLLAFLTCVACSRLVSTALAAAMQTRRLRDVALAVGPTAGLVFSVGAQLVSGSFEEDRDGPNEVPVAARVVARVLPSGPASMAVDAAREGDVVLAVVAAVLGVAVIGVLLWLWRRALAHVLTTARDHAPSTGRRRRGLLAGTASLLPANRFGAVVAKEVRLAWRDPRQRATYLGSVVPALAPLISFGVLAHDGRSDWQLLLAAIPPFVLGAAATNLFGFDGPAHWTNVAASSPDGVRDDLVGKGVARLILMAPFVTGSIVVLGVLTGGWSWIPLTLALAAACAGVTIGAGFVASVTAPMTLPDSPTNPFSTGNAGQGMAVVGTGCATMIFSSAVLAVPAIVAVRLGDQLDVALILIAVCLALGASAWTVGLRLAVARARDREAELLAALGGTRGA